MKIEQFRIKLNDAVQAHLSDAMTSHGDWTVKGFIDCHKNIYSLTVDTKVISKIIEWILCPVLKDFASKNNMIMEFASYQNYYPDLTFQEPSGRRFAVDIKTTYRTDSSTVNGFTLGAFTGYFRNRKSCKNIAYPYNSYASHLVLGVIYSRQNNLNLESQRFSLQNIDSILSVITDLKFFVQEKYKLASCRPGSGNTKNIGSITDINSICNGQGPFAQLGEECFNDYWMYYLTGDMARGPRPYGNLKEYFDYKKRLPERPCPTLDEHEE